MYPRSFLCEVAKIKQRTPLKKELCEIGEEAIWVPIHILLQNITVLSNVLSHSFGYIINDMFMNN